MTAERPAAGTRRAKPSITIESPLIRAAQRRMALVTIVGPFLGTVAAVVLAFTHGIGLVEVGLLVGGYVLTSLGIELGFHRYFAHRSYETYPWLGVVLAILGSMAAEGSVLYWAAGHRRHHAHSDTGDDPHSPHVRNLAASDQWMGRLRGLWHAHIGWMMSDKVTNCTLFAKDILRSPVLRKIHELYVPIVIAGLVLPGLIGGLVTGTLLGALTGFLWGGLTRMFLVHHSTWSNASFSHVWGRRPFDTGDESANNLWCALPTFGASLQNNHHMFPSSAYLGFTWWEVDLGGYFIRALKASGLAWNVKERPSEEKMAAQRVR